MNAISTSHPNVETLLGSSPSTGEPPTFQPIGTDPIFDMIEQHRAAYAKGEARGLSDRQHNKLADKADRLLKTMLATEPTTAAGLRALTEYMRDYVKGGDTQAAEWALDALARGWRAMPEGTGRSVQPPHTVADDPDPIFGLIENHKAARVAFDAVLEPTAHLVKTPKHLEVAVEAAADAEREARYDMHETTPMTLAGLAAYVAYFHDYVKVPEGMKLGQLEEIGWEALPTIAEAMTNLLPSMTRAAPIHPSSTAATAKADINLRVLGAVLDKNEVECARLRPAYNASEDDDAVTTEYELYDEHSKTLTESIIDEQATTLEGFVVKARALAYIYHDGLIPEVLRLNLDTTSSRLIWSILSGLVALGTQSAVLTPVADAIEEAA